LPSIGWSSIQDAGEAGADAIVDERRTAGAPPCPGRRRDHRNETARAIAARTGRTRLRKDAGVREGSGVFPPVMPVPTNAASQSAASMIWAWKALGVPSNGQHTVVASQKRPEPVTPRGAVRSGTSRSRGGRRGREAAIELTRCPEQLALLALGRSTPSPCPPTSGTSFAMRVIPSVHQDVLAEKLDDGLSSARTPSDISMVLEEAPGSDVSARRCRLRGAARAATDWACSSGACPGRQPAGPASSTPRRQIGIAVSSTQPRREGRHVCACRTRMGRPSAVAKVLHVSRPPGA